MPQLTLGFTPRDIRFPVVIGQDAGLIAALFAAGLAPNPTTTVTAILDTGTNISAVTPSVAATVGLGWLKPQTTHTAAGPLVTAMCAASVGLPAGGGVSATTLIHPHLHVLVLPDLEPGVDFLFGLDLLLSCRLLIDGPASTFTLDF